MLDKVEYWLDLCDDNLIRKNVSEYLKKRRNSCAL